MTDEVPEKEGEEKEGEEKEDGEKDAEEEQSAEQKEEGTAEEEKEMAGEEDKQDMETVRAPLNLLMFLFWAVVLCHWPCAVDVRGTPKAITN